MKRLHISLLICCTVLVLSTTSCEAEEPNRYTVQETEKSVTVNTVPISMSTVVINDLELQVPSSWTIQDHVMFYADKPVLKVETFDFDENKLKQEFQYESTEACIRSLLPNGVYLQSNSVFVREIHGFSIYEFVCTADKYSEAEDMFIMSDDIVYLDYVIQSDKNRVYCIYFMYDMAEEDKVIAFLNNMQMAKMNTDTDDREGQYRWMIAK